MTFNCVCRGDGVRYKFGQTQHGDTLRWYLSGLCLFYQLGHNTPGLNSKRSPSNSTYLVFYFSGLSFLIRLRCLYSDRHRHYFHLLTTGLL